MASFFIRLLKLGSPYYYLDIAEITNPIAVCKLPSQGKTGISLCDAHYLERGTNAPLGHHTTL
jgi:hypothetical protein